MLRSLTSRVGALTRPVAAGRGWLEAAGTGRGPVRAFWWKKGQGGMAAAASGKDDEAGAPAAPAGGGAGSSSGGSRGDKDPSEPAPAEEASEGVEVRRAGRRRGR